MENKSDMVSDQTNSASGEISQEKDVVKYDTYRKAIGELKALKSKIGEYEAREQEREQSVLAEQGKYKEALESSIKKQKDLEAALEAKEKAFAKKIFTKEVQELAIQFGARKEALDDIVKVGDWSNVEIDENFSINKDQLKAQIANLSKAKPFFFVNNAHPPRDVSTSTSGVPTGKGVQEMTKDEILAQLRNLK